jgi:hypothetical protein
MSSPHHYVPLLKGKRGEFDALGRVPHSDRFAMTPLIDVPPPKASSSKPPLSTLIPDQVRRAAKARGEYGSVFFDLRLLADSDHLPDGTHAMVEVARQAAALEFPIIPVTGPRRSSAYQAAAREAEQIINEGLCFRLYDADMGAENLEAQLWRLLEFYGTEPPRVDIILDFRAIEPDSAHRLYLAARGILSTFPTVTQWRSLTFAATAFPFDLSAFGKAPFDTRIPRGEWIAWRRLQQEADALPRLPQFGDYGISHPELVILTGAAGGNIPVSVRYTLEEAFLVRKVGRRADLPPDAFRELARWLVAHPDYKGPDFSWGDAEIKDIATNPARSIHPDAKKRFGAAESWRKIGTSHHLAMVARQLREL